MIFTEQLKLNSISPTEYLSIARQKAKDNKLNYKSLVFSEDGNHKLQITDNDNNIIKFGRVLYADYIIYWLLENKEMIPQGIAHKKRIAYLKRSGNIKGNWINNLYSKNNLARAIIW